MPAQKCKPPGNEVSFMGTISFEEGADSFNSDSYCNREFGIDIMTVLIFCSLGKCCKEYVIKECKTHQ